MVNKKKPTKKPAKKTTQKRSSKKRSSKKKTTQKRKKRRVKQSIIIQSPVDPSIQLVVASEMADDKMIEQEIMGEVLPYFIYQFKQGGKTITGLTVKGVSEVVRRLNRDKKSGYNIRINPKYQKTEHNIDQDGEIGVQVSVFGENLLDGNSGWGIKFEPYHKTGKNGKYKNEFAVEKALSKAERNAKRKLIPEQVAVMMIEKLIALDPKNVKQLEPPQSRPIEVIPVAPKKSTPEELEKSLELMIGRTKDISVLIDIDKKLQDSKIYSAQFKKKMHSTISVKVTQLEK
ncbi:hypothetical protein IID20_01300 [Patescibacteria group bacterium]|nr:hypothetical protein [Patescibacteria group bacterium]